MQKDQTKNSTEKNTEDKVVNIDDIVKELKNYWSNMRIQN